MVDQQPLMLPFATSTEPLWSQNCRLIYIWQIVSSRRKTTANDGNSLQKLWWMALLHIHCKHKKQQPRNGDIMINPKLVAFTHSLPLNYYTWRVCILEAKIEKIKLNNWMDETGITHKSRIKGEGYFTSRLSIIR